MSMDIEKQYDKIYRYCYFKLHNREAAEDIIQEAFLKYLERYHFSSPETALRYLYTIARNLCIDEFRKPAVLSLADASLRDSAPSPGKNISAAPPEKAAVPSGEDKLLTALALQNALQKLSAEE